ncbi:MAG: DUF1566 domain-containing protein [Nitrospirae bacterium]|nr:DUF1566 domain-containing protein [Nitrospirota bacterium]
MSVETVFGRAATTCRKWIKLMVLVMAKMLIVVALFTVTTAVAGIVNLPQSGQTTCRDASGNVISCTGTGEDGDVKAGSPWPSPRFVPADNGATMRDTLSGLTWMKDASTLVDACNKGSVAAECDFTNNYCTWQGALDYVACLNSADFGAGTYGHTDWRLPNINELTTLFNFNQPTLYDWLTNQGFTNVQSPLYWSSTTYVDYPLFAWYIVMDGGYEYAFTKMYETYVWPVSGGQPATAYNNAEVFQTGQTSCWDSSGTLTGATQAACSATGEDAGWLAGVVWPEPRFKNNGKTVTDGLTGLIWMQDASTLVSACNTGSVATECDFINNYCTWQGALDYVKCLNVNNYLSYGGWRLPNAIELKSLIDYQQSDPALPPGNPFINVRSDIYWTSSTYAFYPSDAWFVFLYDGGLGSCSTTNLNYVWPVLGGRLGNSNISHTIAFNNKYGRRL